MYLLVWYFGSCSWTGCCLQLERWSFYIMFFWLCMLKGTIKSAYNTIKSEISFLIRPATHHNSIQIKFSCHSHARSVRVTENLDQCQASLQIGLFYGKQYEMNTGTALERSQVAFHIRMRCNLNANCQIGTSVSWLPTGPSDEAKCFFMLIAFQRLLCVPGDCGAANDTSKALWRKHTEIDVYRISKWKLAKCYSFKLTSCCVWSWPVEQLQVAYQIPAYHLYICFQQEGLPPRSQLVVRPVIWSM